jgi:amidase
MSVSQFPFGTATSLVRVLRQRKVSSLELLNAYLTRIDEVNPAINAVVVQDRRAARAQARKADEEAARGIWRGPLHGLPMTVKEAFDLKGHATTMGYPSMTNNMAKEDALAVQRFSGSRLRVRLCSARAMCQSTTATFRLITPCLVSPITHGISPAVQEGHLGVGL